MINLALAVIWGIVGVSLLVYHAVTGDPHWRMRGDISMGWAGLFLCAFNLARYWISPNNRRKAAWLSRDRRAQHTGQRPPEYDNPNPDFMFGDEPPPKK